MTCLIGMKPTFYLLRLNANIRSAFVELCVHGLDHRRVLRDEDMGQAIGRKIVENSLFLLISSPEFYGGCGYCARY